MREIDTDEDRQTIEGFVDRVFEHLGGDRTLTQTETEAFKMLFVLKWETVLAIMENRYGSKEAMDADTDRIKGLLGIGLH